jgi:hypothetical protein
VRQHDGRLVTYRTRLDRAAETVASLVTHPLVASITVDYGDGLGEHRESFTDHEVVDAEGHVDVHV